MLQHFDLQQFRRLVWTVLSDMGFAYHHAFASETWLANHFFGKDEENKWSVRLILCLLMEARERGHVCVPLDSLFALDAEHRTALADKKSNAADLPNLSPVTADGIASLLIDCGIATLEGTTPARVKTPALVRKDTAGWWLYLSSDGEAETDLAAILKATTSAKTPIAPNSGKQQLAAWFASLPHSLAPSPEQQSAVMKALDSRFFVLSGGPGTGKTSTVFHLLRALWHQHNLQFSRSPTIALAAPTGRAAARMRESLSHTSEKLSAWLQDPTDLAFLDCVQNSDGATLHRLLGISGSFRRQASNAPLPFDIVIVDEASMVDLRLMRQLVARMGPQTRLFLVGDHNQLPSVESGAVLAELIESSGYTASTGISSAILTTFFRSRRGILDASLAVLAGRAETILADKEAASDDMRILKLEKNQRGQLESILDTWITENKLKEICRQCAHVPIQGKDDTLRRLFEQAQNQVMLSAFHGSYYGVEAINRVVSEKLKPESTRRGGSTISWFAGMVVMASKNDYDRGFFNGDRGIVYGDGSHLRVWFPRSETSSDADPIPSSIQGLEPAFAITIHKSQGSEFDTVFMFVGEEGSKEGHICRELLYTGMTRARTHLTLIIDPDSFTEACSRSARRWMRLANRLLPQ